MVNFSRNKNKNDDVEEEFEQDEEQFDIEPKWADDIDNEPVRAPSDLLTSAKAGHVVFATARPGYQFRQVETFVDQVVQTLAYLEAAGHEQAMALHAADEDVSDLRDQVMTLQATVELFRAKGDPVVAQDGEYVTESMTKEFAEKDRQIEELSQRLDYALTELERAQGSPMVGEGAPEDNMEVDRLKGEVARLQEETEQAWAAEAELREWVDKNLSEWEELQNKAKTVETLQNKLSELEQAAAQDETKILEARATYESQLKEVEEKFEKTLEEEKSRFETELAESLEDKELAEQKLENYIRREKIEREERERAQKAARARMEEQARQRAAWEERMEKAKQDAHEKQDTPPTRRKEKVIAEEIAEEDVQEEEVVEEPVVEEVVEEPVVEEKVEETVSHVVDKDASLEAERMRFEAEKLKLEAQLELERAKNEAERLRLEAQLELERARAHDTASHQQKSRVEPVEEFDEEYEDDSEFEEEAVEEVVPEPKPQEKRKGRSPFGAAAESINDVPRAANDPLPPLLASAPELAEMLDKD